MTIKKAGRSTRATPAQDTKTETTAVLETYALAEAPPMRDLLTEPPDFSKEPKRQSLAAVQRLVSRKMEEMSLFGTRLSIDLGKNSAYINQFIGRGKPRCLPEDVVRALALLFDVDPWRLRTDGYKGMPTPPLPPAPAPAEATKTAEAADKPAPPKPALRPWTKNDVISDAKKAAKVADDAGRAALMLRTRKKPQSPATPADLAPEAAAPADMGPRPRPFISHAAEDAEAVQAMIPLFRLGAPLDVPMAMMPPLPAQHRAKHAFAITMTTDSGMLRRGHIVFCVYDAPLHSGDTVAVILDNRVDSIAELVDQAGDVATVRGDRFGSGAKVADALLAKVVGIDLS